MDLRGHRKVREIFSRSDYSGETNYVSVFGQVLGIEERGVYGGREQTVVLMRTEREWNKAMYVWILMEDTATLRDRLVRGAYVLVEGKMATKYGFNKLAVSHTFILPDRVMEIVDEVSEMERHDEFYLNYTVNNRVVLEGTILNEPWREYIPPAKSYVTRFAFEYELYGKRRKIYCTVWDTVTGSGSLKKGDRIRVTGSFSLLKKERGLVIKDGVILEARKNKLDSYVIVVQRIESVSEPVVGDDGETVADSSSEDVSGLSDTTDSTDATD